jgi:hypothetical protein
MHNVLADIVMVIHFAFVLFVLFGALLALRWPIVKWVHIPSVVWSIWIQFTGGFCPLTPLEIWLREKSGEGGYDTGFIEYYIGALIYPGEIPPMAHAILGVFLLLMNLVIYAYIYRRDISRKDAKAQRKSDK